VIFVWHQLLEGQLVSTVRIAISPIVYLKLAQKVRRPFYEMKNFTFELWNCLNKFFGTW
jgi:hypothetical protein